LYKEDGMTRMDCGKCIGCGYCVDACPFNVPVLVDGRSTKCDGCALATKAGGQPWCVKTCPTHAIEYGDREEIMQEARTRLAALKPKYPNARIYGETEAGGLGVIMVLPDEPSAIGLPDNPASPVTLQAWQKIVQPASVGLTSLSVAVAAVAAVISRRNHMQELKDLERQDDLAKDSSLDVTAESAKEEEV
jgi:formate dehydrogenase iron-sulfur subunit